MTTGLLVAELVRGQVQLGDDPTGGICPIGKGIPPCPSAYPVAGDVNLSSNRGAPTYGDFAALLPAVPRRQGVPVGTTFIRPTADEPFTLSENAALASAATTLVAYDATTGHNLPALFWDYMGAQPTDWLFAFGHPLSEPVWVRAPIRGVEQWVLVQVFERRVLTYTPANPPAWHVEMGNVGQHYYAWRYAADNHDPPWIRPLPDS